MLCECTWAQGRVLTAIHSHFSAMYTCTHVSHQGLSCFLVGLYQSMQGKVPIENTSSQRVVEGVIADMFESIPISWPRKLTLNRATETQEAAVVPILVDRQANI